MPSSRGLPLPPVSLAKASSSAASAAGEPHALYQASEGFEAMEFARTASRLFEMGSESYLALPHGRSDSTAGGASTGLVET